LSTTNPTCITVWCWFLLSCKTIKQFEETIFEVVMPCSLVEFYWHFRGIYCFHFQGWRVTQWSRLSLVFAFLLFDLKMEVVYSSESLINFYQTTNYHIPEDISLHIYHHENIKTHVWNILLTLLQSTGSCNVCTYKATCTLCCVAEAWEMLPLHIQDF
jgi:hypothetical protein